MNELSGFDSLFTIKVNDEIYAFESIQLRDSTLNISMVDNIQYTDTVTLSYSGTALTSVDRGKLHPVENFPVLNPLPEPVVFVIPGMVVGELFNNLRDLDPGDWIEYDVNVAQTAIYTADIRVSAPLSDGILYIQTHDDEIVDHVKAITRATGGWQIWKTNTTELPLYEGRHVLRLTAGTAYYNLNWVDFRYSKTLNGNALSARTSETGDAIEITFDKELAEPERGEIQGFSVYVYDNPVTVDQIGVNYFEKNILLLKLEDKLSAVDENITVSYEPGMIVSLADNIPVTAFSNIQVTNNVTTGVDPILIPNVSVYPNPADDRITLESNGHNITSVEVVNITGKRIQYKDLKPPQQTVNLDLNAPPGVYLLKVKSNNLNYFSKLIVD